MLPLSEKVKVFDLKKKKDAAVARSMVRTNLPPEKPEGKTCVRVPPSQPKPPGVAAGGGGRGDRRAGAAGGGRDQEAGSNDGDEFAGKRQIRTGTSARDPARAGAAPGKEGLLTPISKWLWDEDT